MFYNIFLKKTIKKIYDSTNNSKNTFANVTKSVLMENTTYFYTPMLTNFDNIVGTYINTTFEDTNSVFYSLLELKNLSISSRRNNISFRETTDITNSKEKSIETFSSKEEKKEVHVSIDTSFCSKDQGFIYYQNFLINIYYQNFLINKNKFFDYLNNTELKNVVTLLFLNFNNNNNKIYD